MIMFHALDTTGKATDEWVGRFYEIGTAVVTAGGIGMLEGWWDIPGGYKGGGVGGGVGGERGDLVGES